MDTTISEQNVYNSDVPHQCFDAVVIGAGPYGLSIAAHLKAKGLTTAIFGKPMEGWRGKMPKGVFLRSQWWSTDLSDPQKRYDFKHFFADSEYNACHPMPAQLFIDYGLWFQKHAVPAVDQTYVTSVERKNGQFLLKLEDNRELLATTVVVATGPDYYQYIPEEYKNLPKEFVYHSCECGDASRFVGKKVVVIGGGQSALEWAALLNEAGASVEVVARRPINWLETHGESERSLLERIRAPHSGIAPGWRFLAMEIFPYFFQRFATEKKARMVKMLHWPAASLWVKERIIGNVTLHEGQVATEVVAENSGVKLTLTDKSVLHADYIIAATGYHADVSRVPFLCPSIVADLQAYLGSPILNTWFESSVPGLYFAGFATIQSFGPLYRFVAGAPATAARIAHAAARYVAKTR
jgi:FAD-dependent urate hydroxylase